MKWPQLSNLNKVVFTGALLLGISSVSFAQDADGSNNSASSNDTSLSLTPVAAQSVNSLQQRSPDPHLLFAPPSVLQRKAFGDVTRQAMPMTPDQIHHFKQMLAATQQAASASATQPPKPITSSMMVSLAPGATPPVIDLQKGFITSLVFVDSSGNKWPIVGYDLGNPSAFNIQWNKGSNTILVQANSLYTYGNLAVTLKGTTTPVMLTLVPGQNTVDYRVDLHVQGQSPDALSPMSSSEPAAAGNTLLNVLNGIPPAKAKALQLSGGACVEDLNNCQGWLYQGKLYLRIPNAVLSPSWLSTMQSSDGVHAYVMQKTPNILVTVNGQAQQVNIKGY